MFSKLFVFFAFITCTTAHAVCNGVECRVKRFLAAVGQEDFQIHPNVKVFRQTDALYNAHNCKEKFHLESREAGPFNLNFKNTDLNSPSFSSVEQCVQWMKIGSHKFFGHGTQGQLKASDENRRAGKLVGEMLKPKFGFDGPDEVLTFQDAQQQILNLDKKDSGPFLAALGQNLPMYGPGVTWGSNWERIANNYVNPLCMWKKFTLPSCRRETFMVDSNLGSVIAYVYQHPNPKDLKSVFGVTDQFLNDASVKSCFDNFLESEVKTEKNPDEDAPLRQSWAPIMSHVIQDAVAAAGEKWDADQATGSPEITLTKNEYKSKAFGDAWRAWRTKHALNIDDSGSLPANDLRMIQMRWESKCDIPLGSNVNVLGNILTWIHKKIMLKDQGHGLHLGQIMATTK